MGNRDITTYRTTTQRPMDNHTNIETQDYSKLDFFISHGSVDQVIPSEWAKKAPLFLNELNIKNSYKEYPVGHGVAPQNFFDFKKWIEKRILS